MKDPELRAEFFRTRADSDMPIDETGKQMRGMHLSSMSTKKRVTSRGGKAVQHSPHGHKLTKEDRRWGSSKDNPKTWFYQEIVKLYLDALNVKDFKDKIDRYYEARRLAKVTVDATREAMARGDEVPVADELMDKWEASGGRDKLEQHLYPSLAPTAPGKKPRKEKTLWVNEAESAKSHNTEEKENERKTILWSASESESDSGAEAESVRCSCEPGECTCESDPDTGGEDPRGSRSQDG